jgi:hypothetical protein
MVRLAMTRNLPGRIMRNMAVAGLTTALVFSCAGDPLPQPPTFRYALVSVDQGSDSGTVVVSGREGATDPGASLEFFNFNLDAASFNKFDTTAADDGSFSITMPGWRINRYRVVVITPGYDPGFVDFHGNYDSSITVDDLPVYRCFGISELYMDFGTVVASDEDWTFRALELSNGCDEIGTITITDIYLSDRDNFTLFHSALGTDGIDMGEGAVEEVGLYFDPVNAGEIYRNLVVGFTDGERNYEIKIVIRGEGT